MMGEARHPGRISVTPAVSDRPYRGLEYIGSDQDQIYNKFRHLWLILNEPRRPPVPQELLCENLKDMFPRLSQYFHDNTPPKIINLHDADGSDRADLVKRGLFPEHLLSNLRKTITGAYLDPLSFQLTAIKEKSVYGICPSTGNTLRSSHSLLANINTIFYRFDGVQVFYIITAGLDGFKKNALYFPRENLVIVSGKPWTFEIADLIELQARMVSNFGACYRYLYNNDLSKRRTAVCVGFFHFAHHLWNELPGIDRLLRKKTIGKIDKFFILREPLGKINEIFPELNSDQIERKNTIGALFDDLISDNYFVIKVGSEFITNKLVNRVYEVSKKNCRPDTHEVVQDARRKHFPLLWVGIRVGSRSWINQVDGLAKLIERVHSEFPQLGVVFDGFSLPADRSGEFVDNQEYGEILRQETTVVSEILQRLERHGRALGIFNIVGSSVYDANVWAHTIDVYLSPYGTLQHKVGWFADKPGIIHSNKTVLRASSKHLWAAFERVVKPRFARHTAVVDVGSTKEHAVIYRETSDWQKESGAGLASMVKRAQSGADFENYEVDWEALYIDLIHLIRSPKILHRMDREVLLNMGKRKVKKIVRIITNYADRSKI
jgi:hypothetical protein